MNEHSNGMFGMDIMIRLFNDLDVRLDFSRYAG